jgi:hypothetical protein
MGCIAPTCTLRYPPSTVHHRRPPCRIHHTLSPSSSSWTISTATVPLDNHVNWRSMGDSVPACTLRYVPSTVHHPSSSMPYPPYPLPVLVNLDHRHGDCTIAPVYTLTQNVLRRPRMHASLCTIDRPPLVVLHVISTILSSRPRRSGPSLRLLHNCITIYIDVEWAASPPHARFVMYHRPSTTRRPPCHIHHTVFPSSSIWTIATTTAQLHNYIH